MRCPTTQHIHYFLGLFIYDSFNYILPPENPPITSKEMEVGILKKYENQMKQCRASKEEARSNIQCLIE